MRFLSFKLIVISILLFQFGFSQTTVTYNYTGGVQNFVVPPCVTSISVTAAGADGGGTGGGNGAVVTGTLAVTPGQTIQITVGGSGNCPGGGFGGGGNGQNANNAANGSCGGGGATTINVAPFNMGSRVIVAGGGGGMGGGTQDAIGGAGGCGTGVAGTSPFGQGGGGATQTSGGTAGPPWITSGNPGTAGSIGQGGNGGTDPCYNNSPGGGGGGGYYGGGGGGSDCFATSPYGGGSGGGGSSLVPAGGGCTQDSNNGPGYVTITYTSTTPTPTATNTGPYCVGGTIQLNGTGGGTYSWTGPNGFTSTAQNPTLPATAAAAGTYTLTVNVGGCTATATTTVTVNPAATVNANIDQTICAGGTVTLAGTFGGGATSATWSAPSGSFSSATSMTAVYTPTITSGSVTITLTSNDPAGPCPAVTDQMIVTVNPVATVNANIDQTICAGGTVTLAGAFGGGATSATWSAPTGSFSSATNMAAVYTPTITSGTVTITLTTDDPTGPCPAVTDQMIVTVNPVATVNANIDQTICAGGTVTLAGAFGGGATSATWSAPSGSFSNATSMTAVYTPTITSGTVTITLTSNDPAGPCPAVTDQMIVTVNPVATVNANIDQTICAGGTVTLAGAFGGGATSATWSAPSGSFSSATTMGAVYTPTITSGTVTITLTTDDPAGPCPAVTDQMIVTVNPVATVNANIDQTICAGGTVTLAGAFGGGATSATWSAPSGSFSNATSMTAVYTPTITSGTVTITLTSNDPAGPCPAVTDQMIVTVNPVATVNANIDQTICAGGTVTLAGAFGGGATSATWSAPSGSFSNATSMTAVYTPTITSGTVTITLSTDDPAGPCPAVTDQMIVTVNPVATVNANIDQTICAGGTVTLAGAFGGGATSATWSAPSGSFSSATNMAAVYTPTITSGTVTITLTSNDPAGPCPAVTDQMIVTVNPVATVNANIDQTICSGGTVTLSGAFGGGASSATWSAPSGSFSSATNMAAVYTPTITSGTVTITLSTDDPAGPCPAVTDQMIVTVNPVATVNANIDQTICAGGTVTLAGAFGGGATTATWSAPSGSFSSATNMAAVYTPTITSGTVTITLTSNDPAGPCPAVTDQMIVTVNANIVVNAGSDAMICPGASITLTATGASTYSWLPGGETTASITVSPAMATTYTVTGTSAGCFDSDDVNITIDTPPTASNPAPLTFQCLSEVPVPNPTVVTDEADNTGAPTVTFLSDVSNGSTCPQVITRTYRVTDACGLYVDVIQTITIDDTTPPTGNAPSNVTVQCTADIPVVNTSTLTGVSDNCTATPIVAHVNDVTNGATCPLIITRTYSITDDCGNQTLVNQTITVDDTTPPTASNPATTTVPGGPAPAVDPTVVIDEADNCTAAPVVAFVSESSDGQPCPETITRIYSVTDDCGNSINVTHTILITDPFPPTASNPAPINVECIADVPAPNIAVVIDEADNQGTPTVAWVSDVSDNGTCPEIITRTYSVTDVCGGEIFVTQTITVHDITAPVFSAAPTNVTVACVADVPAMTNLGYTDNCDPAGSVSGTDVSDGNYCPETITRTWTYTDACGNTSSTSQTIIVHDLVAPVFAAAPANVTVACAADVPAMANLGYTDNCDPAGSVTGTDVSNGGSCPEIITRTWTYTDACGNTSSTSQTITVHDLVAPVFAAAPANVTVECPADVPAMTTLAYTDNCDPAGTVTGSDGALVGGACGGTITRTWTFTDACGNTATTTQTITVDDATPPTASNPATTTVPGGPAPAVDPTVVIDEADNCTAAPVVAFVSESSDGQPCPETITRIYSVTDDCGNSINVTHTILITDPFPPTASNPAPINVECIADVPAPNIAVVIDEADNQGTPTVAWVSDVSDNGTCPEIITRTYSVTDVCGGEIFVTQTITVHDITAPVFSAAPTNVTVACVADVPAMTNLGYTDNCDPAGSVSGTDVSDGNSCPETITRTWTYTDACGNTSSTSQTIIVHDLVAPVFAAAPANVTVACAADVPAMANLGYTDNCDPAGSVTGTDVSNGGSCPEIITRTWTYTDACGNTSSTSQTIIVHDLVAPVFAAAPANVTVACAADVPAMANLGYTDNCDPAGSVTGTDVSNGGSCPEIITRTWTYTDACGNTSSTSQTITVHDLVAPVFAAAPANVMVECPADVPAMTTLAYTDNCDPAGTVTGSDGALVGGACGGTITRTWTFTDACGNTATTTQTITVDDTTPPTASNPATTTVPGGPAPAVDPTVVIDEADNCTAAPVVAFVSESSDGQPCPETITRIYSVTDDCGNSINVTHTILITDPFPPTASNPAPINVECIADVPAPNIAVVIDEADNQGTPTVAWVSDVSDNGTCPETITRTYSVTDVCNNQILVTQTIVVNDITAPTATAPATVNVQCIADVPAYDVNLITDEADNCTAAPVVAWVSDVSDNGTCPETITRTYSITDDCGNQTLVSQTIIVNDDTAPTASNPTAVTVECIFDVPATDVTVVTDEADNCTAVPVVAWVSDVSDNGTCPETITRTYSITDDCGNLTLVTQSIIVNDITNPTASNPATTTVPGGPAPAVDPTVVIDEADNCTAAPVVAFVSESSDGQPCPETITRIYSVTDDCGNSINVTHTILITDPINPTASNPAPINVECIADVPAPNIAVVIDEADNQGTPTVAWVSDVSDNGTCPETITRTYSVTDVCNNQILVTQTIVVNDITAPTATAPATVNVQCIADVPAYDVNLITDEADNCTAAPVVAWVSDISDNGTCPETITRTYSITDDCGNQTFVSQTIIVNDDTAPTASNPTAVTVECIFDVPATDASVVTDEADNCTAVPVVAWVSDVSDNGTCPETITRTYSITDDCGNQTLVTQSIIVNDITNPTASNPAPIVVELASDVPAPDPLSVIDEADNCTSAPIVAWVNDVSDNGTCPEIITRTYSVTDDCGNTINVVQTITINDITLPTASNPSTVNVECVFDVPVPDINVVIDESDNSGIPPTIAWVSDVSDNGTCPETITRTYSVTDNCNNQITVEQLIVVNDVTPPTATAPTSVSVECIEDVPPVPLSAETLITDATDNCDPNPTIDWVSDVSDNGSCPETITRTYRVMDDCGNQTLLTQTIIVNDLTAPTASNPASINVECIFDVPLPNLLVVTDEADNCTVNPIVAHVSDVSDGNTCPETITRTYSVTDDCGNQTLVSQTIIVNDITNPTASNPTPISVVSTATVPAPDPTVVIDEADNCTATPVVTWVSDVSDGNICNNEQITRTYQVTDDCGNSITVTQIITITAIYPTINAGVDQEVCNGASITLNATFSPSTTVISWPNPIQNGIPFVPAVGSSSYVVTANNYGCISTDQVNVTVNPLPQPSFVADENMGCEPLEVTFTNTSSSATAIVSCSWNMGDGTIINGCGDQTHLFESAGLYTVGLTTTDANGCTNSVSYSNLIYVEPYPIADFSASAFELNNLMISSEVDFYNQSVGATNYIWDFGDGSASSVENPTHIFETEDAGSYEVMLVASSPLGCADTAYHTFTVTEELIYYVPNTFTPDGNQFNNTFQPVFTSGFDPYDFTLLIYNRWGELIFESHDAKIGWDGTYGGKLMQDGTYTWKINFKSRINDEKFTAVGHVNLIR